MDLAKPCLDVGVFTNKLDEMRAFYEHEVGLAYGELLKIGGGTQQHRLVLRGSVFKLNHHRDALPEGPSSFRRLLICDSQATERRTLRDPDGTPVHIVAPGVDGITEIAVAWASSEPDVLAHLLIDGFDAERIAPNALRVGTTVLLIHGDADLVAMGPMRAVGFRYLTVQVRDVVTEHKRLLDLGWSEGSAPIRLGEVAYVSFVRDPNGAWIEISQRASLTGPLPDNAPRAAT